MKNPLSSNKVLASLAFSLVNMYSPVDGECDLVYMTHPTYRGGLGMDIHVRLNLRDEVEDAAHIDSIAVQIGQDKFEVSGTPKGDIRYWINGNNDTALPTTLSGHRITQGKTTFTITVDEETGEKIIIKASKHRLKISIKNGRKETFMGALGLVGPVSAGHAAVLMDRNGEQTIDDMEGFAQEWSVSSSGDPILFRRGMRSHDNCHDIIMKPLQLS